MIEIELEHDDLARMRFAHSPIRELVASVRALHDSSRHQMYGEWRSAVRSKLGGLRLELLIALAPSGPYALDFLAPSSTRPWGVLADELEVVAATSPTVVRADIDWVYQDRSLPAVLRPLYDDPIAHLPTLVAEMNRYWQAAVESVWPRVRVACVADLSYRMTRFAAGGIAHVLEDLHPGVSFRHNRLQIDKPYSCRHRLDLAGAGIAFVPCAFSWPTVAIQCCGAGQPTLSYPPRGVAELWGNAPAEQPDPLFALVGRTRATLLAMLGLPTTTTQLAEHLALSPAAVSQQLKILKDTALVTSTRHGRLVLYQRTAVATALLVTLQRGATTRPEPTYHGGG